MNFKFLVHLQSGNASQFLKLIFNGVSLLYNVVSVFITQQSESAILTHISSPLWTSFLFGSPYSALSRVLVLYSRFLSPPERSVYY